VTLVGAHHDVHGGVHGAPGVPLGGSQADAAGEDPRRVDLGRES
jgi:hypothetical protein